MSMKRPENPHFPLVRKVAGNILRPLSVGRFRPESAAVQKRIEDSECGLRIDHIVAQSGMADQQHAPFPAILPGPEIEGLLRQPLQLVLPQAD
ncbi:hypothetical protein SDC9_158876 [bioreactor metagenome]|uniref:Uncharacterized protein n=1 Tax=bioreactor metagenome TaxID=1076179 RepID=A0A645FH17_9ZZZZ